MKRLFRFAGVAVAAALTGCTTTLPLVGSFDDYNEVFLGTVNSDLMTGTSTIAAKGKNSGITCSGGSVVTHVPASNYLAGAFMIPYCAGQTGVAQLSCSDGRRVDATWTAESCSSGYGEGLDSSNARFQFAFGLSEQDAEARFKKAEKVVAAKPELPAYRPKETRKKIGFAVGTGFLITRDGYMITNFHVIDGAKEVLIHRKEGDLPAKVIKIDKDNDVALLKADVTGTPIALQTEPHPKVAQQVMALGYPLIDLQGQALKASFGHVNALSGIQDDPRFMQIDVPIQPGNSGGPLINEQGQLLGVVTATLDQLVTLQETGTLPQNVNYAVKSDYVQNLIGTLPGIVHEAPVTGFEELVARYGPSVFLVVSK